jgi:hypothetical protein
MSLGANKASLMGAAGGAAAAGDFYAYQIANSCRMPAPSGTAASNSHLTRTVGTVDSNVHWTLNFWIKRSAIEGTNPVSSARPLNMFTPRSGTSATVLHEFLFGATGSYAYGDAFAITNTNTGTYILSTNNLFRDTSAWYNIHIQADLDNGTASEKLKIFVNGTEASYNADNRSSYTSMAGMVAGDWTIGDYYNFGYPIQSYLAQWCYIDGTTYAASDFGETKNGVWIPKDPSGLTFGSEGFYLKFQDSSALGDDSSGNTNDWTSANLSTHDQMKDSPTFNDDSNAGNFCTLGPLWKTPNMTFSEGNLQASTTTDSRGIMSNWEVPDGGKWYWEIYVNAIAAYHQWLLGINYATVDFTSQCGGDETGVSYDSHLGTKHVDARTGVSYGDGYTTGDVISVAVDRVNDTINFAKNGSWQGTIDISGIANPTEFFPWAGSCGGPGTQEVTFNFGQDGTFAGTDTGSAGPYADDTGYGSFYYDPTDIASGFLALCAGNFATPAADPADDTGPYKYFVPKLYTGDGAVTLAITGLEFQPDFTWIKNREATDSHCLFDSTRGVTKLLSSNNAAVETTDADTLKSWTSDGYTVGADVKVNTSGEDYASWNLRANGGTTAANSIGGTASVTQIDPSGAFSIVTYTGFSGASGTSTVGHGLSVAPQMIIHKSITRESGWWTQSIYTASANHVLNLNSTAAPVDLSSYGSMSEPTDEVFSINGVDGIGGESANYLSYCFASKEGFSRLGEYVGNADADGTFIYCGFRPAMMILKELAVDDWGIYDDQMGYNGAIDNLYPNLNYAQDVGHADRQLDILSNGFKLRTSNATFNASGANYIYLAIAQNPFKYSNAR